MSTAEEQAMGVERLTFEVHSAQRNNFSSIQPLGLHEAQAVLDALATARKDAMEWKNYSAGLKRHLDKETEARKTAEGREDRAREQAENDRMTNPEQGQDGWM